jgi:hypothetical protein
VPETELSPSLTRNPELDAWIRIHADGTVTLFTGKAEFGQGIKTAIAMIGAEELDISIDRVAVRTADTAMSPDELYTVGSSSIEESGNAMRRAAADARRHLVELAAERLGVHVDRLEVTDGTVHGGETGRQVTYWELLGDRRFGRPVTGRGVPKSPDQYAIVGRTSARLDLPGKVTGTPCFVHDMERPGMVHGRVVRPPSYGAQLLSLDDAEVRDMSGVVEVVRDGRFIGVLAEREEQAVKAMRRLASLARWSEQPELPPMEEIHERLQRGASQSFRVVDGTPREGAVEPFRAPEGRLVEATYRRPFHMHASLGPSAAMAERSGGSLTVWSHSQGVSVLRVALAQALEMKAEDVRVVHVEGAGCYGHNGADDAALDAALLAHAVPGRPVLLQWMREDENAWEPYGPAMVVKLQAVLDGAGSIAAWSHDVWSYTHMGRPLPYGERSGLLAAWHRERPMPAPRARPSLAEHAGIHRNADPIYDLPERRIVKHFVDDAPLRVSSTRGLGAYAMRPDRVPSPPPGGRARPRGHRGRRGARGLGLRGSGRGPRARHRLRALQEPQVLRGGHRRARGRFRQRGDPAGSRRDRRRRRSGGGRRRTGEPARGRPDPVRELDAQGAGQLRRVPRGQCRLAELPDPDLPRGARDRDRAAEPARHALSRQRGGGPGTDPGGDRQCGLRRRRPAPPPDSLHARAPAGRSGGDRLALHRGPSSGCAGAIACTAGGERRRRAQTRRYWRRCSRRNVRVFRQASAAASAS